jgi:hypothetical protein
MVWDYGGRLLVIDTVNCGHSELPIVAYQGSGHQHWLPYRYVIWSSSFETTVTRTVMNRLSPLF